ncbi:peptidase M56 [Hanstruepera neustonica]|uniref:Peptidase M56 n=1 Tax=Hanstruepera neustonica TaxID=1445657 RepID=A0A2K1E4D1_9FLAO|nr:M56 family metallopeptidase [Hanstruepera neustonica]PNQ75137.1 peptidase M56 [Hanstruepera neustonica]
MILYILKFSACLAVFMLFYKLFLEKESFHQFKRGYLLGTLIISAIIPLITFTTYVEVAPLEIPAYNSEIATPPYVPEQLFEEPVNSWSMILWTIYSIGVLVFTIRFGMNLCNILKRIKHNPKFKNHSVIYVLLHDSVQPHTFLNYIFFNKTKYEAHEIPQEVLFHEETHAREKHALDILFIEVFQIVFWFNPLLYFIKKDIKLNHEFLADQAVINQGFELKNYQNTLLAFSSNDHEPQLANAINYSSIKKRFTVMKTHTSKHIIWVRSLVLLPLLAILIYSFSTNKIVEKTMASNSSEISHTARSIDIDVLENGTYKIAGSSATKATFVSILNQLHQDISPEIRNRIINVHVNSGKPVSDEEVWFIYNNFIKYGFHRIVTFNQEIIREKGNTPFAIEKKIEQQKGASKEQIAEYNKLAKYYNSQKGDSYTIKLSDMKRLKYLYDLMTEEQRKSAEPFPNFPPPPPEPEKPLKNKEPYYKVRNNSDKQIIVENGKAREVKAPETPKGPKNVEVVAIPPPPPPVPANATKEQKEKYQKISEEYYKKYKVENGKVSEREPLPPPPPKSEIVEVPPPPPPPKSPLDHVIDMAKKGATFYYEGKQISSDKAIEILKTDKSMNISTKNSDSKNPKVYLSKEPIKIKNK